jgi:hypothetical protein
MIDLHHTPDLPREQSRSPQAKSPAADPSTGEEPGFDDYMYGTPSTAKARERKASAGSTEDTPGFEDYMEQQAREMTASPSAPRGKAGQQDTPGFEDYVDRQTKEPAAKPSAPKGKAGQEGTPGFEDYID